MTFKIVDLTGFKKLLGLNSILKKYNPKRLF